MKWGDEAEGRGLKRIGKTGLAQGRWQQGLFNLANHELPSTYHVLTSNNARVSCQGQAIASLGAKASRR